MVHIVGLLWFTVRNTHARNTIKWSGRRPAQYSWALHGYRVDKNGHASRFFCNRTSITIIAESGSLARKGWCERDPLTETRLYYALYCDGFHDNFIQVFSHILGDSKLLREIFIGVFGLFDRPYASGVYWQKCSLASASQHSDADTQRYSLQCDTSWRDICR